MAQDFYELLRITPSAATEDIQNAFRIRTEHLVKRLQNARENNADISILRDEHKRLTAAKNILLDPQRRKSYDIFRSCMENGIPNDIQQFWEVSRASLVPPQLTAALRVVQQFTQLPIERLSIIETPIILKTAEATTKANINLKEPTPAKIIPPSAAKKVPLQKPQSKPHARIQTAKATTKTNKIHLNPERLAAELGYSGAFIRRVREHRNITIEQIYNKTKIKPTVLKAIEEEAFDDLPSTTFVRGYLGNIAKILRIEHLPFVNEYMRRFKGK